VVFLPSFEKKSRSGDREEKETRVEGMKSLLLLFSPPFPLPKKRADRKKEKPIRDGEKDEGEKGFFRLFSSQGDARRGRGKLLTWEEGHPGKRRKKKNIFPSFRGYAA